MKQSAAGHLASLIVATALTFLPSSSSAAFSGSVACTGSLTSGSGEFSLLHCDGDLSFTDARVTDPLKVVLVSTDALDLVNTTITSITVGLYAARITFDNRSSVTATNELTVVGTLDLAQNPLAPPLPLERTPPPPVLESGRPLEDMISSPGATLTLTAGGRPPANPERLVPPESGQISLGSAGNPTTPFETGETPPPMIFVASNVPEPSVVLLLVAGLGAVGLAGRRPASTR